ncbi:hypothetical protein EDD80_102138 [Anseongella ginsenosidimutans]|uniref:MG2 domain-containing protein n=1 Tax=Anseongella ginsenosidimutans TaxID=496056 RepID=A0A4R3KU89_9SPHI|nr:hypothetical protein [Anseongella ginsenosidimutans]QEC51617.1 hypothetical protein FRZ59_04135 [Anseongella ginsenosidimutans]TCS88947.1 hypothetical protein EDD80_102138 [Anseongella ginsenosidimutans]
MKTSFKLPACLIFLCLFAAVDTAAQVDTLVDRFSGYREKNLQERLYVHTDRSFYLSGEILWFKIYAVAGPVNFPDSLSKVAYLEVLDRENNAVMQAKVALKGGSGSGSLDIPFGLSSGNYRLRAYTRWMKNFSPEYYFEKELRVVNTTRALSPAETGAQEAQPSYDLQFFPEGGDLVQGLRSRVAFKITDRQGKGVEFRGILINGGGDTLLTFRPLKYGMGSFFFTPLTGEGPYTALVRTHNGEVLSRRLPEARGKGYVMKLEEKEGKISVTVNGNDQVAEDAPVYLLAHTRQRIRVAEMQAFQNGRAAFGIEKARLGEGISHFTLFNASLQPVSERLYFRRPEKELFFEPAAAEREYGQRARVSLEINTRNAAGKDIPADMSVAVYRLDSLEKEPQADIFSWLWLSSDLQGKIEDPEYYLQARGPEADEALDNLMLTQGWRRFKWEDVLQRRPPLLSYAPEYQGHIVTGKVTDINSGKPAPAVMTYLSVPGKHICLKCSSSDGQGRVQFTMQDFYGPAELVVQTGRDSTKLVQVTNPFSEVYAPTPLPAYSPGGDAEDALSLRHKAMHIQRTYSGPALQQFLPPARRDSMPFYYQADKVYRLDDYVRFTTMEEVMREYVPEVIVRKRAGDFRFMAMNIPVFQLYGNSGPNVFFQEDPLVLLDGVPVFDINRIISYDPLKVEKLEVVGSKYYLGPLAAEGIVSYTTYKGNLEGFRLDPGSLVMDYEGLQLQREFYAPAYGSGAAGSERLPDFRSLLFWSPDVRTGRQGAKAISFYTSDIPGNYLVFIQGITPGGHAGSGSFRFRVAE